MSIPPVTLNTGHEMPILGLGTWRLSGDTCTEVVRKALELGYTHIDTAELYDNHAEIAAAIKGLDRSELFITSKVPRENLAHDDMHRMCKKALRELEIDYLDLYLAHWPNPDIPMEETFRAFQELHEQGKVRSIGVSNFNIKRLSRAIEISDLPIAANQVEFHPLLYQKELLDFCTSSNVVVTAYSPIARGAALDNDVITRVAQRNGRTPAQVSLRWLVQKGIVVIPKASSDGRLRENMDIFDWDLSPADEQSIDNIGEQRRLLDPEFAEF